MYTIIGVALKHNFMSSMEIAVFFLDIYFLQSLQKFYTFITKVRKYLL